MGTAGLPGTGLGGLFYLGLAIAMPVVELVRGARGRGSRAGWRHVGGHFALALGIVAATLAGTAAYVHLAGAPSVFGLGGLGGLSGLSGLALLTAPAVLGVVVLALLLATVRGWAWLEPRRRPRGGRHRKGTPTDPPTGPSRDPSRDTDRTEQHHVVDHPARPRDHRPRPLRPRPGARRPVTD